MVYYKKTISEVSMAKLRYLIRRLSVQAMLSYAILTMTTDRLTKANFTTSTTRRK